MVTRLLAGWARNFSTHSDSNAFLLSPKPPDRLRGPLNTLFKHRNNFTFTFIWRSIFQVNRASYIHPTYLNLFLCKELAFRAEWLRYAPPICEISGLHRGVVEVFTVLRCYAADAGSCLPTFWYILSIPSSTVQLIQVLIFWNVGKQLPAYVA
jgi:hypothetical protein